MTIYRKALIASYILWAAAIVTVASAKGCVESVPESETPAPVVEVMTVECPPAMLLTVDESTEAEEKVATEPESPFYREDIPLDYDTQGLLYEACGETGIRYELALAVIWKETTFRNVVGDGGESYGYMQVQPRWHADRMAKLGATDLMDPLSNFRVGCDFLAELLEKYELPQALTTYNTGSPGHNQYASDVIGYMEGLV